MNGSDEDVYANVTISIARNTLNRVGDMARREGVFDGEMIRTLLREAIMARSANLPLNPKLLERPSSWTR